MKNSTETVKQKYAYDATIQNRKQARAKNRRQDEKQNTYEYN